MKKAVRKSKQVLDFIIDKMCEGLTPAEICRKYPEQTPDVRQFYKWCAADDELYEATNRAYFSWLMCKFDEMEDITTKTSAEMFPQIEDPKERYEARRVRVDALKFALGKMAPILNNRFNKQQKVEHSGEVSQIQIVDYSKGK